MFSESEEYKGFREFVGHWKRDPQSLKDAFLRLKEVLSKKRRVILSFKARPGISYSLRAGLEEGGNQSLFALVDVVDDDPENRWLSVCFYEGMISDPIEKGNLIPGGLLDEDGYCFDLYEGNDSLINYIEERIEEAYSRAIEGSKVSGKEPGH